jgi:hypothetical protein
VHGSVYGCLLCPIFSFCFVFWSLAGYLHVYLLTFALVQFSLPLPQGGRDAIAKNLILREDQLPQKFLYPKTKKKANKQVSFLFMFTRFVRISSLNHRN